MQRESIDIRSLWRETFATWQRIHPELLAAALSYFALFSLAPLLLVLITLAGRVVSQPAAQQMVMDRASMWMTSEATKSVQNWLTRSAKRRTGQATVFGLLVSAIAGSQVLGQMKRILNLVWEVPRERRSALRRWLHTGSFNLLMLFALGMFVALAVMMDTGLAFVWHFFRDLLPWTIAQHGFLLQMVNFMGSLTLFAILLGLIYRYVPDTTIEWQDVVRGALLTSLLLALGKVAMSVYLGLSAFKSIYGAASSVLVVMLSMFLASNIFIFGAAFTRTWSEHFGSRRRMASPRRGSSSL